MKGADRTGAADLCEVLARSRCAFWRIYYLVKLERKNIYMKALACILLCIDTSLLNA